MPLLCLILAGGESTRMGQDKALLFDSVNSLAKELVERNCNVIVACGSQDRDSWFDSQCWFDPVEADSLGEIVYSFVEQFNEEIQLFPCDMYSLDSNAIDAILAQPPGVPVDVDLQEQPTLARIAKDSQITKSKSLRERFSKMKRNNLASLGKRIENFNFPNQIDALNKSNL